MRAIKPNSLARAHTFDKALVLEQLASNGVMETIRVRQRGFPFRFKIGHFLARYWPLLGQYKCQYKCQYMC